MKDGMYRRLLECTTMSLSEDQRHAIIEDVGYLPVAQEDGVPGVQVEVLGTPQDGKAKGWSVFVRARNLRVAIKSWLDSEAFESMQSWAGKQALWFGMTSKVNFTGAFSSEVDFLETQSRIADSLHDMNWCMLVQKCYDHGGFDEMDERVGLQECFLRNTPWLWSVLKDYLENPEKFLDEHLMWAQVHCVGLVVNSDEKYELCRFNDDTKDLDHRDHNYEAARKLFRDSSDAVQLVGYEIFWPDPEV